MAKCRRTVALGASSDTLYGAAGTGSVPLRRTRSRRSDPQLSDPAREHADAITQHTGTLISS
jgi:hypothetical protein